jgi:hypothetical protein
VEHPTLYDISHELVQPRFLSLDRVVTAVDLVDPVTRYIHTHYPESTRGKRTGDRQANIPQADYSDPG